MKPINLTDEEHDVVLRLLKSRVIQHVNGQGQDARVLRRLGDRGVVHRETEQLRDKGSNALCRVDIYTPNRKTLHAERCWTRCTLEFGSKAIYAPIRPMKETRRDETAI